MATSAPGKVILFGEHAVVYGEPSLSFALDLRFQVEAELTSGTTRVNGEPLDERHHAYLIQALRLHWGDAPLDLRTRTTLPSASGVGSSAALSVAMVGALLALKAGANPAPEVVARGAFETERSTQGAASPNDTSVCTAGGAVTLARTRLDGTQPLWEITSEERTWFVQRIPLPKLNLVLGNSGVRARTGDVVARVREAVQKRAFVRRAITEIGEVTREGIEALRRADLRRVGELMDHNEDLLRRLGVETPPLRRLLDAAHAAPGTLGAKLTGKGAGGSILVLTDRPSDAVAALERAGAKPLVVVPTPRGLEVSF